MSSIFLQVGQCGNQLSYPFWNNIIKSQVDKQPGTFTSLDDYHRSIHIDSEPKVIASLPKNFKVRRQNIIIGKRGRGSNFALGYNGLMSNGDNEILEKVIDSSRKEIERCDSYSGAIIIHSLSGGTGSGLGCRVIETLREEYPCRHIMSCAVMPFESGESPLQSYNTLLAINWLQSYTDSVILLQNDVLSSRLTCENCDKQVSFKSINHLAASLLSGICLPTDTLSSGRGVSLNQEPWELVRSLTPVPSTKFISLFQHRSSKLSWEDMVTKTLQQHPKFLSDGNRTKCLGATVIARGDNAGAFLPCLKRGMDKKIKKSLYTVEWNPYPIDCWTSSMNSLGSKSSSSLTLATNGSNILDPLGVVVKRAGIKMKFKAYLHWYRRHGITDDTFEESIETLETITENYKAQTGDEVEY